MSTVITGAVWSGRGGERRWGKSVTEVSVEGQWACLVNHTHRPPTGRLKHRLWKCCRRSSGFWRARTQGRGLVGVSGGGWGAETTLLLSCILCTDHTWKWSIKKKKRYFWRVNLSYMIWLQNRFTSSVWLSLFKTLLKTKNVWTSQAWLNS